MDGSIDGCVNTEKEREGENRGKKCQHRSNRRRRKSSAPGLEDEEEEKVLFLHSQDLYSLFRSLKLVFPLHFVLQALPRSP